MSKVHDKKPLNALVVVDTFNKLQGEILERNSFKPLPFLFIETDSTGAKQMSGTDYLHRQTNICVVTSVDDALQIAVTRQLDVIVTGWDSPHSSHNILAGFARERAIPVLTVDRPITETILLMTGSLPPRPLTPPVSAHLSGPQAQGHSARPNAAYRSPR